jgi:hypothetical protein
MERQFSILIVDSHGEHGEVLRYLEAQGFRCEAARGPLRVRSLLEARQRDAIVWIDRPNTAELNRDFFREWRAYPGLPIIHLFPVTLGSDARELGEQIAIALPYEAYESQLRSALERTLLPDNAAEHASAPGESSELAFRNVFAHLRNSGPADAAEPVATAQRQRTMRPTVTAINTVERERLFPAAPDGAGASGRTRRER